MTGPSLACQRAAEKWPSKVTEKYDPVRILGTGGFGSVILARNKNPGSNEEKLIAIKVIGDGTNGLTRSDLGYAHRESDILKELHHPNIMKFIDFWEPDSNRLTSVAVMALGYAPGPTVESLIKRGGSLSSLFSRTVVAQVIDAISFLHSHAVVHRDIKPDNIVVTGASSEQDDIWDNTTEDSSSLSIWEDLRTKWHVTLIDFGFARALTPEDVTKPSSHFTKENLNASYHKTALDVHGNKLSSKRKSAVDFTDKSISRKFERKMSALGNRNFVAPEVLQGIKANHLPATSRITKDKEHHITETIGEAISQYGLLVDAFSLGYTLRYMMTGVPPNRSVEMAIAEQNSVVNRSKGWVKKRLAGKASKQQPKKRKVRYRRTTELPDEAQYLIEDLTEVEETSRLSVRGARRRPWIKDVLPDTGSATNQVKYLNCALHG